MKAKIILRKLTKPVAAAILMLFANVHCLFGQGTAFTYQGRLTDNGSLPNASYDMKFSIYASAGGGNQIGSTILQTSIPVNGGLFTTPPLDFGASIFTGPPRWLKIEISPAGANTFTSLSPRELLTASPYAVRAGDAGTLAGQSPSTFAPATGSSAYVAKAGDTMTGNLVVSPNDHGSAGNTVLTAGSVDGTAFYCHSYNQPFRAHNDFTGTDVQLAVGQAGNFTGDVSVTGNVGIGTAAAGERLTIAGVSSYNGGIKLTGSASTGTGLALENTSTGGHKYDLLSSGAADGIGAGGFGIYDETLNVYRLAVSGDGTVSVGVLQINGADLAEPFEISTKELPKGSVVTIDAEHPGQLKLSERAYDKKVAGILSGANGVHPGIRLKQDGFNDHGEEVALSGRVYALADASEGEIEPGDLLTTSSTPGHCMKAIDAAKSQGAIIGKAMSSLKEGKGMVLVLVSLQ